ncbi:MAG: DegQ family serine endoprotease [Pseudomonadota bacterium]|nr:DegQ family serine endoprotease [Pseudomonadota bacterium]MDE3037599.1 DegQ family serine endoprotease [Pseudomonadota bacterium]
MLRSILILCILPCLLAAAPAQASPMPPSFADLVDKLSPAVVNVSTEQKVKAGAPGLMPFPDLPDTPEFEPFRQFFNQFNNNQDKETPHEVYSLGSGFIIDASGYIVTNNHVIDDADEITVTLPDKSKYKAKIIGRDKKTDLALLKVDAKKPLPYVTFGDSDAMRVGDWVIAIGNPYGLGGSVTQGIISARQRNINSGPFDDFLQTDAAINRGNSGGPLFNEKGEVIGINTAIFSPSGGSIGIGFAIPAAVAGPVIKQIKKYGRTHRGWLGVKIQDVSDEAAESVGLPKSEGALVIEITPGSPAEKAGLKAGDVITSYNGHDLSEMRFLPRLVAETKIGASVPLTFWRDNEAKTITVTVGELKESEDGSAAEGASGKESGSKKGSETIIGLGLAPLTAPLRDELGLGAKQEGLAVLDVAGDSEAAKAGMRAGDVILDVNGGPTHTVAEFRKALETARKAGRKYALVKVMQDKDTAFVALPTSEGKK